MLLILICRALLLTYFFPLASIALGEPQPWVEFSAGKGTGQGKHIVLLSGDEEYRSEEGLPMLARLLSEHHGFRCTVLFAIDPKTGEIDPNNQASLPGSEALESADAIVMLTRFRAWPDEAMKRFVGAYEAGKPIIGLRTCTHPFQFPAGSPFTRFNKFGENIFGEEWVSHWGKHKFEATRGTIEPAAKDNPILRGVTNVFGDTDVYEAYPPADATILMRGEVLSGMKPDSPPASYRKKRSSDGQEQDVNGPPMPIAWTRIHQNNVGNTNRVFCTTMGAATDLENEGLRQLVVNAVFWGLDIDVPEKANVDIVGNFEPTAYGFDGYVKSRRPAALR